MSDEDQCIFCGVGLGYDNVILNCTTCKGLSNQVKISEIKINETLKVEGDKIVKSMGELIKRIENYHQYLVTRADNLERENNQLRGVR
jgi:hypothetical protein